MSVSSTAETGTTSDVQAQLAVDHLRVDSLHVDTDIVDEVTFELHAGEILGVVGESGSGKTTVAMALLGVARTGAVIAAGSIKIVDREILGVDETEKRALRGRVISFVPQDPSTALSPAMRIGEQISEIVAAHFPDATDTGAQVENALRAAQLPPTGEFIRRYPHELRGGQQQRVTIAMALVCRPDVIVMDEPTTGLDVTTQSKLLVEIRELARTSRTAIVYVSHNLGVIRNLADHVAVMYAGRIVESGRVDALFVRPLHPYTRRLLEAIPRIDGNTPRGLSGVAVEPWNRPIGCPFAPRCEFRIEVCDAAPPLEHRDASTVRCWRVDEVAAIAASQPRPRPATAETAAAVGTQAEALLDIRSLVASYPARASKIRSSSAVVVSDVHLQVSAGACLGILGESGSGKTTLLRCIAGMHPPIAGELLLDGAPLAGNPKDRTRAQRRSIQLVPQNPDGSLNPKHTVGQIIGRPLQQFFGLQGAAQRDRVLELLDQVRLRPSALPRLPRELSGGEKQRVAIARALASEPMLLLCDEITSALDVVVQAGILELLQELQQRLGMTTVFVSHDLAVIRSIGTNIAVMRDGRILETQPADLLFARPNDDYTRELIDAVPMLQEFDYPGYEFTSLAKN